MIIYRLEVTKSMFNDQVGAEVYMDWLDDYCEWDLYTNYNTTQDINF